MDDRFAILKKTVIYSSGKQARYQNKSKTEIVDLAALIGQFANEVKFTLTGLIHALKVGL